VTLEEFVSKGWQEHATDAAGVFLRLADGVALCSQAPHVAANGSDSGELFFAREALSRAKLKGRDLEGARFERDAMAAVLPTIADEGLRTFAAEELAKLDAALAAG
jgi:hypothetical protein